MLKHLIATDGGRRSGQRKEFSFLLVPASSSSPNKHQKGGGKEHKSRRQPWLSVPPPSQRRSAYIRPSTLYIRPSTTSHKKFQTGYCWLFPVSNPARCSMGEKGMGKCRRKKKRKKDSLFPKRTERRPRSSHVRMMLPATGLTTITKNKPTMPGPKWRSTWVARWEEGQLFLPSKATDPDVHTLVTPFSWAKALV